ncbi:hypothetical protein M9458_036598, partial [Cirrhinus mrigala]
VSSVHRSAPEVSSVRESAPVPPAVAMLAPDPPKGAADTTIESPEVAAYAAEPLEVAASSAASPVAVMPATVSLEAAAEAAEPQETATSVLAPCTVVAPNNSQPASVLMPGLEPAMEAVYELSPCPVPAMFGLSALPVTVTKAANKLSASLLVVLSASSVPALPRSQFMTRVLAPPWMAPAPPALPWRAPAPPAMPPALPWRAPALLTLPQSPGPPHGPGPPILTLSRPRPTAPLDSLLFGASGSRSLVGGSVTNPVRSARHQWSLYSSHHTDCYTTPRTMSPITHRADCANTCGQS